MLASSIISAIKALPAGFPMTQDDIAEAASEDVRRRMIKGELHITTEDEWNYQVDIRQQQLTIKFNALYELYNRYKQK